MKRIAPERSHEQPLPTPDAEFAGLLAGTEGWPVTAAALRLVQ